MKRRLLAVLLLVLFTANIAEARRDRGSWKKPLHEKAVYFEKHTAARHNIVGSYPSMVQLIPPKHYAGSQEGAWAQIIETGELPPGWTVDHGTTGVSNIAHTSSWTGCYLTSQAFRVAFLRDKYGTESPEYKQAYERANEVIHSLRILTLVTGQPGYLVRGVALGHGLSYEERGGTEQRDLWGQGVGEYSHLRYRGGPSHHNYDHVFRGLGTYYFIAADDSQKQKIREIVADMSEWAHMKNDMVVMHVDGERVSTVLIGGWRGMGGNDRPSGGSVMALTGLKIAHLVTGDERAGDLYDHWVNELGMRDPEKTEPSIMGRPRSNYDDTDHLLGDLYLLNIIEKDPQLLAFYRKCVKDSWEIHKDERMAWFNYVYAAVLGDEYADPEGSLWYLQTHPTSRVLQPQMNSIRTDIEFITTERGGKQALHPLPVHERPFDNEYAWKQGPYELDRWLARTVAVLEISPHDPYVQLAAEASGGAFYSNTRGEIWHSVAGLSGVKDYVFSPKYPWIVFAATNHGVYRSMDGGENWSQAYNQPVEHLEFAPDNSNVLYAVGSNGIFKSADLGERETGLRWRSLSGEAVTGSDNAFAIDTRGERAKLFLLARHGFYSKQEGEVEWSPFERPERVRGFGGVDPIGGQPLWLRVDQHVKNRLFRAVESRGRRFSGPSISVSNDGGETWSTIFRELQPYYDWRAGRRSDVKVTRDELRRAFRRSREFQFKDLRVDQNDPDTWYGLMEDAVAVTRDAGVTWNKSNNGLDIPRVHAIWTPRHADLVMAGTPAGMYVSDDSGKTWTDTTLVPQGGGAIRTEIGGIGYLTAYWIGRYHSFITEETALATFGQN